MSPMVVDFTYRKCQPNPLLIQNTGTTYPPKYSTMARSGLAKGANKGHITEQRERAPRPSRSKGVSSINPGAEMAEQTPMA